MGIWTAIDPAPEERPAPAQGEELEELLKYFTRLDQLVQDDEFVEASWQRVVMTQFRNAIRSLKEQDEEALLTYWLGLHLYGAANRDWTREVLNIVNRNWEEQRERVDPFHPPLHRTKSAPRPRSRFWSLLAKAMRKGIRTLPRKLRREVFDCLKEVSRGS